MQITSDAIWAGPGQLFGGALTISGGTIAEVARYRLFETGKSSARSLLLPGFVNAHCHLDLSLPTSDDRLNRPFIEWLLSVKERRQELGAEGLRACAASGIDRAQAAGITTLVDYDSAGHSLPALAASPLRRLIVREVIRFNDDLESLLSALQQFLSDEEPLRGGARIPMERRGLAPHAPYTVHPSVLEAVVALAESADRPWSMHVAEQPFETEFLRQHTGEFARFFEILGLDLDRFPSLDQPVVRALHSRGLLRSQPLLVHGNYLDASDIDALALSATPLVFCPRSHRWFGHSHYPLEELLRAGVTVALGTDGQISNGEISILEEMRELRRSFPDIDADRVLAMATTSGHQALGNAFGSGNLLEGEPADFVRIEFRERMNDPLAALLAGEGEIVEVFIDGGRVR